MGDDERIPNESMASIGAKLKSARESKSLTIAQVQKGTRIYSTILAALEEGRCDEILTSTYVKSFLRKYSGYLGLDSNTILKEYLAVHPEETGAGVVNINTIDVKKSDIFSRFIYVVSFILLSIAFLSLMTFLGKRAISIAQKPRPKKTAAISLKKHRPPLAAPKISVSTPQVSTSKKGPFNLVLKVKQSVKIQVKKDGIVLFNRVLQKGMVESFTAEEKIELYAAKAEAIELVLDNKPLSIPAKGIIKDLEITRKGVKVK